MSNSAIPAGAAAETQGRLSRAATQQIAALCAAAPGVETGGLLVDGLGQVFATGPGPGAVMKPHLLEWDASYIAGVLDAVSHAGVWRVVGRWHKHTSPVIDASVDDRGSAERFRQLIGAPELVDVVVACDADDRTIGWAVYLCTAGEYRLANL